MDKLQREENELFRCTVAHGEDTYKGLMNALYNVFGGKTKRTILIVGGVFLICGVMITAMGDTARLVMIVIGCWIITAQNSPAKAKADELIKKAGGRYPTTVYTFFPDKMTISNKYFQGETKYDEILKITQDNKYIYLLVSSNAGHVIDKEGITPKNVDSFCRFIERKTGETWFVNKNLFSVNIYSLLGIGKNTGKKKKQSK